jgi:hypothetical protein
MVRFVLLGIFLSFFFVVAVVAMSSSWKYVLFGWSVAQTAAQSFTQSVTHSQQSQHIDQNQQAQDLPKFPQVQVEQTDSRGKTPFDYVDPLIGTVNGGICHELCATEFGADRSRTCVSGRDPAIR